MSDSRLVINGILVRHGYCRRGACAGTDCEREMPLMDFWFLNYLSVYVLMIVSFSSPMFFFLFFFYYILFYFPSCLDTLCSPVYLGNVSATG
jgi:hypothetical protein